MFLKVPSNRLYGRRLIDLKEVVEFIDSLQFIDAKVMLLHAHKVFLKQFVFTLMNNWHIDATRETGSGYALFLKILFDFDLTLQTSNKIM